MFPCFCIIRSHSAVRIFKPHCIGSSQKQQTFAIVLASIRHVALMSEVSCIFPNLSKKKLGTQTLKSDKIWQNDVSWWKQVKRSGNAEKAVPHVSSRSTRCGDSDETLSQKTCAAHPMLNQASDMKFRLLIINVIQNQTKSNSADQAY